MPDLPILRKICSTKKLILDMCNNIEIASMEKARTALKIKGKIIVP
jgi:hypothetical protein